MSWNPVLLDLHRLRTARIRLHAGDEDLTAALASLAPLRDTALSDPAPTVCAKATPGPTGDPHDYLSIPTYHWPDPSTPDGLPWIPRDGAVNPAVRLTDVDRFFRLVDRVEILTLHAWYGSDDEAARRAVDLVRTWFLDPETRMHPALDFAQLIPGEAVGSHWGVIDFQRAYLLLDLLAVLRDAGAPLTDDDVTRLRDWFRALRTWLLESEQGHDERSQPGNHATWYDVQVVAYALTTGDASSARRWLETVTVPRLPAHIGDDGSQPHELSRATPIEYAVFNLFGFVVLAEMGRAAGFDLWARGSEPARRIASAVDWLLPYLTAQLPIGRTTKHRGSFTVASEAALILRIAADRLDRSDYATALDRFVLHRPESRANLLLPDLARRTAEPARRERPPVATRARALTHTRLRLRPTQTEREHPFPKVFVVGCPRSGTVWTVDILDRHPLTVVGPESHLFGRVYTPLVEPGTRAERRRRTLRLFDESGERLGTLRGPQHWIDRATLERCLRQLRAPDRTRALDTIDTALRSFFAANGGTPGRTLVEKTPDHVHWSHRILERWPEARIVEVLRDGRDVVASLGHMEWAPADRRAQITKWVAAVERAAAVRQLPAAAGRWHVVRFEALKSDPYGEITRLYDFLDLPCDQDLIRAVEVETEFARMQHNRNDYVHRRRGIVGSWRTELSDAEIALVEDVAGSTLAAAGYAADE